MADRLQARRTKVWSTLNAVDLARAQHDLIRAVAATVSAGDAVIVARFADEAAAEHFAAMSGGTRLDHIVVVHQPRDPAKIAATARLADADVVLDLEGAWKRHAPGTKIEWTEEVWNPWIGCSAASAGCTNCYAQKQSGRKMHDAHTVAVRKSGDRYVWTGQVVLNSDSVQSKPLKRKRGRVYFTSSMTDVFHEQVQDQWLVNLHAVIEKTPHHVYQILTKRIERAATYYAKRPYHLHPNIWLGTSVEDERVQDRVDILRSIPIPADQRWLSLEPLIGPLNLDLTEIRWIIAGGESGLRDRIRPVQADWVRVLRDQCLRADIPFFLKQWGDYAFNPLVTERGMTRKAAEALDGHAKGGALLDGRLWREVPEWRG